MKKSFKIILPILVLAMLIGALCVFVSAETADETVYFTTAPQSDPTNVTEHKTPNITDVFNGDKAMEDVIIELKADVQWGAAVNTSVKGTVTVNLNGHTFNMNEGKVEEGKQGRIGIANADSTITFNNGSFKTTATIAKFFNSTSSDTTGKGGVTFNQVDITCPSMLFDLRFGHLKLIDCTLTSSGYAICLAGNWDGGYNVLEMTRTTYYHNGTAHAVQVGRDKTSKPSVTVMTLTDSAIISPNGSSIFKNITTAKTDANPAVDLSGESHTLVLNNSKLLAPKGTLIASVRDSGAKPPYSEDQHYFTSVTTSAGTEICYDVAKGMGYTITPPTGCRGGFAGPGMWIKYVPTAETFVKVNYVVNGVTTSRNMVAGTTLGLLADPVGTFKIDLENKKLTEENAFFGWLDADGNKVTAVPTDVTEYTVNADLVVREAKFATFKSGTYTVDNLVTAYFDTDNLFGNLKKDAPYVMLFSDCLMHGTANYNFTYDWALTIDLNGYGLTMKADGSSQSDSCFRPNGANSALNIKNGTLTNNNCKIAYPGSGGKVTIDNCKLIAKIVHLIDGRGGDIAITNSEIDVRAEGNLLSPGNGGSSQVSTCTFKNVKIYSSNGKSIARVINSPRSYAGNKCTIIFENVEIDAKVTDSVFGLNTVYSSDISIKNCNFDLQNGRIFGFKSDCSSDVKVTIDGLTFADRISYENSAVGGATMPVGVVADNGNGFAFATSGYETQNWDVFGTKTTAYAMAGVIPVCPVDVFTNGTGADAVFYQVKQSWLDANMVAAVAGNVKDIVIDDDALEVKNDVEWAVFKADGTVSVYGTAAEFGSAAVSAIPDGGTLCLYADVATTGIGTVTVPVGATIDLGGHTYDQGSEDSAHNRLGCDGTYTVKNGTFKTNSSHAYLDSNSVNATYENVTFVQTGTTLGTFDIRKGNVTLKNCTFTVGRVFNLGYRSSTSSITMENCNVTAKIFLGIEPIATENGNPVNPQVANTTVNVSGSTVKITDASSSTIKSNVAESSKMRFNFTDCTFTGTAYFNASKPADIELAYVDCEFAQAPTATEYVKMTYGDQVLVETTDAALPYKTVEAAALAVSANLTLYTDFVLNFYLPANTTAATVNGVAVTPVVMDEVKKVSADKVSALGMVNDVTVTYTVPVGEFTTTATVTYSICDYAAAVLNGEYTASAKALIAGAVRYATAVYAYEEQTLATELADLAALAGYTENVGELAEIPAGTADYTALADVVESVQLALGTTLKYKVNFKAGYTGTVNINGVDVEVTDGGSVNVILRACDFNAGLVIKATVGETEVTGTYDLAAYYAGVKGTDAKLDALLVALYNYATAASSYLA